MNTQHPSRAPLNSAPFTQEEEQQLAKFALMLNAGSHRQSAAFAKRRLADSFALDVSEDALRSAQVNLLEDALAGIKAIIIEHRRRSRS